MVSNATMREGVRTDTLVSFPLEAHPEGVLLCPGEVYFKTLPHDVPQGVLNLLCKTDWPWTCVSQVLEFQAYIPNSVLVILFFEKSPYFAH